MEPHLLFPLGLRRRFGHLLVVRELPVGAANSVALTPLGVFAHLFQEDEPVVDTSPCHFFRWWKIKYNDSRPQVHVPAA